MFYLFGAGSFCTSVIGFCGSENVIAIIDNNESKVGKYIKGKEIISYNHLITTLYSTLIFVSIYGSFDSLNCLSARRRVEEYLYT